MIQFVENIQESRLRMAYNNDVLRFFSTNNIAPKSCEVRAVDAFTAVLYPDPGGAFYFNFKSFVTALINNSNFADTMEMSGLIRDDPNSYIYPAPDMSLQLNVTFEITFVDNTVENVTFFLTYIAGVSQSGDYKTLSTEQSYVLTPFKTDTLDRFYLKYWQGYPFDIPFYSAAEEITLRNDTNLLSQQFDLNDSTFRLILSDGDDDETLENLLPLIDGFNSIRIIDQYEDTVNDKFILLEKMPYKCGVYIKWINAMGGYNYWLFENTAAIDRTTRAIGEIENDFGNYFDTNNRVLQIGKDSQDTVKVIAETLTENETLIVSGITDSPKIYMFTGAPFSRNVYRDWVEITLKSTNMRIKNYKEKLNNVAFDFELPQRYTQRL
ncbi:hypothetical protein Q765_03260 [Flavobacterium rivuli WB 3.3-2 = DSM 21788]|uniref:Uncharacterized protein n=1 Tax=Flavobacterium rivuli WB 3.3-2 = DSM 21788 TaxID=1121895 RepID=A0A0A2M8X0_9FLAO|nr:hypothetical protein [Flavobacterium rivuli]KGO88086.1 hypothetical protein Q765_03260 [Flavobacterium rivuli WB 3.3-2 = DSM 21788]